MSKPRVTSTGRVVFDDRGQSVWEWRVDDHFEKDVDTARLRTLQDTSVLEVLEDVEPGAAPPTPQSNYFDAGPKEDAAAGKRRSLDDMRRLSEEIKKKRSERG